MPNEYPEFPYDVCIVVGCNKPREIAQGRRICGMHRSRWSKHKSYDIPQKPPLPEGIVKICKKHGPLKEEQTKKRIKGKNWLTCLQCLGECEKRFTEKVGNRYRNELKKHYLIGGHSGKATGQKLSKKEYMEILDRQNNVCAICKKPETAMKKGRDKPMRLAIDHCHETHKVRGLLCLSCNSCLARSPSFQATEAAIKYLEHHKKA
jgi:hypothetical protein